MDTERFNRDLQRSLKAIERNFKLLGQAQNELVKQHNEVARRVASMEESHFLEEQRRYVSESFKHASSYANVIVLAGYAAFFALWTTTRQMLHPQVAGIAALLITVSCSVFVLFEVMKMIRQAQSLSRYDEALDHPDPHKALKQHRRQEIALNGASIRPWLIILFLALWPAVLAIGLLGGSFLYLVVAPGLSQ